MQKNKAKTLAAFAVALFIFIISALSVIPSSAAASAQPDIEGGRAIILYDKTHKRYVYEKNATDPVNTSTSAKVTMGLLACELLAERLDETVTVTKEMLPATKAHDMGLEVNDRITVRDLLYGAICGSYNDAAYVIANVCAGSADKFAQMMTARAAEAGAKSTQYVNPTGYPDNDDMKTTASDTLKVAIAASENELYMNISSTQKYTATKNSNKTEKIFSNRNQLISDPGRTIYSCLGMNAGQTGEAGGWSITTVIRDKDEDGSTTDYICVLLGGTSDADVNYAYQTVRSLAYWACDSYNNYKVFTKGQAIDTAKISLSTESSAKLVAAEDVSIYIQTKNSNNSISYSTHKDNIRAPIEAGTKVGKVTVFCNGETMGEFDLVLKDSYDAIGVMKVIDAIGSYTKSRAFIASVVFFVLALGSVFAYKYFTRYRSHGRHTRKR